MKKFERSLIMGAFNPLHAGHEYLLKIAKDISKTTDIYIGTKQRPHRLPRNIRSKSVESVIKYNEWEPYFNIIDTEKHANLHVNKYSLLISGSDMLNIISLDISSRGKKIKHSYKNFYLSFPNILIVNRKEVPLKQKSREKLIKYANIIDLQEYTNISGTQIRKAYKNKKNISKMVSGNVWEVIKDYIHIFND